MSDIWIDLPNSETLSNTWIDLPLSGSGSSGVTSLNGETGAITLVAGTGITIAEAGQDITISATGSGSGNVTGIPPTTIDSIARWADTTGTSIKNSPDTLVQDSGAIEAQGFITMRSVTGIVTVNPGESWIAPEMEITLTGAIQIEPDGEMIII